MPAVDAAAIQRVLAGLINGNTDVAPSDDIEAHPATYRGLVNDADELIAVIAADLGFAHRAGAALAMIPAGTVNEADEDTPVDTWLEYYNEVANVLSRVANEAANQRLHIDPGISHDQAACEAVMASATRFVVEAKIPVYGTGKVAFWT